jgi:hypothetical protein
MYLSIGHTACENQTDQEIIVGIGEVEFLEEELRGICFNLT